MLHYGVLFTYILVYLFQFINLYVCIALNVDNIYFVITAVDKVSYLQQHHLLAGPTSSKYYFLVSYTEDLK